MTATPAELSWAVWGEVGISSATIWSVMTGSPMPYRGGQRPDRPHDPDDLCRCVKLLDAFPSWRLRLPEVAAAYSEWTELVARWDELERSLRAEVPDLRWGKAPKTYALMEAIRRERCCCGARRVDGPGIDGEEHRRNGCDTRRSR